MQTFSPVVSFLVWNKQIFLPPPLADVGSVRVPDSVDWKWHWRAAMLFSLWSINIGALGTYLFWPEEVEDARVAFVIEFVPTAALSGGSGWRLWISDAPLPATFFITRFVCFWSGWSSGRLSSIARNFSEHLLPLLPLALGESMQLSDRCGWSGGVSEKVRVGRLHRPAGSWIWFSPPLVW